MALFTCPNCGQAFDTQTTNICPVCGFQVAPTQGSPISTGVPTQQSAPQQTPYSQPNQQSPYQQTNYQQTNYQQTNFQQAGYAQPNYTQAYNQQAANYEQPYSQPTTYPQPNYTAYGQQAPYYPPVNKKQSALGIISFILGFIFLVSPVGLILAIIDLIKKDPSQKHGLAIAGCILNGLGLLLLVLVIITPVNETDTTSSAEPAISITSEETSESTPAYQESAAPSASEAESDSSLSNETSQTAKAEASASTTPGSTYVLDNYVLLDNEICTVTIVGVEEDSFWGTDFTIICENNTTDKSLTFSADDVLVNGWAFSSLLYETVAPGKAVNTELSLYSSDFEDYDVDIIDVLSMKLRVYDSDDWMADDLVNERFDIYPTGLTATTVVYPTYDYSDAVVLVDNDDVVFAVIGSHHDSIWGYCLDFYIENKTDTTIMTSMDETSINGFMIDPFFATSVPSGGRAFATASFSDSDLDDNHIESIKEIDFILKVYDNNDWFAPYFVEKEFTLTVSE